MDGAVPMVEARLEEPMAHGVQDERLGLVERPAERRETRKRGNAHRGIHLGQLANRPGKGHLLDERHVRHQIGGRLSSRAGIRRLELLTERLELIQHRAQRLAELQRVEVALESTKHGLHLRRHELQQTLPLDVGQQRLAGEQNPPVQPVDVETEDGGHPRRVLLLVRADVVPPGGRVTPIVRQHAQRTEHDVRGHGDKVVLREPLVEGPREGEQTVPRIRVVQPRLGPSEDLRQPRVVGGHQRRLGTLDALGRGADQTLDILHGPERLSPQLQGACGFELLKPHIDVRLPSGRHPKIGPIPALLVLVLDQRAQVVAENVAEPAELGRPLVRHAKTKRALRGRRIQPFQTRVVPQHVQHVPMRLPEQLEPRHDHLAIRPVRALLPTHKAEDHLLGGVLRLQVADISHDCLRLLACLLRLGRRHLHQVLDDVAQRCHIHLLARDTVVDQRILDLPGLLHLHGQVHVLVHDILQRFRPVALVALVRDRVMKRLQRALLLADSNKLFGSLERILRLERHSPAVEPAHGKSCVLSGGPR
mmetsp:Transcript_8542/g.23111  ORF Transcript_8542/g.23111 Transcript_8542/m.23111 type:complete len:535 (-) Transcript_8542:260-1864(-)